MKATRINKNGDGIVRYFTPVDPMLAEYSVDIDGILSEHGTTAAELKYDGYRMQVHKKDDRIFVVTRNLNEIVYDYYPDFMQHLKKLPDCIIEAEMVTDAHDHLKCFEGVKKRFKSSKNPSSIAKFKKSNLVEKYPVKPMLFDIIALGDMQLTKHTNAERRSILEEVAEKSKLKIPERYEIKTANILDIIFQKELKDNQEGLICKAVNGKYVSGREHGLWYKLKRHETLDLAILGFYKESFSNLPVTGILVGTYNQKTGMYETIGKIGTTRDGVGNEIYAQLSKYFKKTPSKNVILSDKLNSSQYAKNMPTYFIEPKDSMIAETRAMNLYFADNWQSCGLNGENKAYSMRIASLLQLRKDKKPEQATTTQQIEKLYEMQGARE